MKTTSVCLYFQVHQPYRLKSDFSFFNIGSGEYEDKQLNEEIIKKVSRKCYLPANTILLKLIRRFKGRFKVSFSITGTALDQFQEYCPEVIDSFKKLSDTGCVEFLSETYYHSLTALASIDEYKEQIKLHRDKIKSLFGVTPQIFRNTELIYSNSIAEVIAEMGFQGILCEGASRVLHGRSPNFLYNSKVNQKLKVLLKNFRLSDDIAFRFSNRHWIEYPLRSKKFANWLNAQKYHAEVINLFLDYETFGEHQLSKTGIFSFLNSFPGNVLNHKNFSFITPSEAVDSLKSKGEIDSPDYISWADEDRSITAWLGNDMQKSAHRFFYTFEKPIKKLGDQDILHAWRKLSSSDHCYYMSTKWANDGAVHSYFSPYKSPHDAFVLYMNVLNDLRLKLCEKGIDI